MRWMVRAARVLSCRRRHRDQSTHPPTDPPTPAKGLAHEPPLTESACILQCSWLLRTRVQNIMLLPSWRVRREVDLVTFEKSVARSLSRRLFSIPRRIVYMRVCVCVSECPFVCAHRESAAIIIPAVRSTWAPYTQTQYNDAKITRSPPAARSIRQMSRFCSIRTLILVPPTDFQLNRSFTNK